MRAGSTAFPGSLAHIGARNLCSPVCASGFQSGCSLVVYRDALQAAAPKVVFSAPALQKAGQPV